MSKERLEEIKQYLIHFYNAVDVEEDIKVYIFNTLKIEWLIEQAELVSKHETRINNLTFDLASSRVQNNRYREALEEILAEAYEEAGVHPDTGMQLETFIAKKARKALEGES